jgi:hypothetical protein
LIEEDREIVNVFAVFSAPAGFCKVKGMKARVCAFGQPVRFGIARVYWFTEVEQISCLLMESSLVFAVIRRPNLHMIQRLGLALILIISSLAPTLAADSVGFQTATTQTPTALEIVERFIQAVGGRDAWLKTKTQYAAGTLEVIGSDNKITVELYAKAPNLGLTIMKMGNNIINSFGFDGEKAWIQTQEGKIQDVPPEMQAGQKRDSDLYKYLHFKEHFPDSKVIGLTFSHRQTLSRYGGGFLR